MSARAVGHSLVDLSLNTTVLNRRVSRSICQIQRKYPFHCWNQLRLGKENTSEGCVIVKGCGPNV